MLHPKAYQIVFSIWGSNPRPSAHKTDALPTELTEIVPAVRFELTKLYATELESAPFDRSGILVMNIIIKQQKVFNFFIPNNLYQIKYYPQSIISFWREYYPDKYI